LEARSREKPQVSLCTVHEILDSGQHTITATTLVPRIEEVIVHPTRGQCGLAIHDSGTPERLTIVHWNCIWVVVHITPTVWPVDIVVQRHRPLLAVLIEELKLVENGVPVVIAVDQDGAGIRDRGKRIEARSTMHDKRIRVISFHLLDVKRWPRVDYMEDRTVLLGPANEKPRVASRGGTHFNDRFRP
jgi:hypothetical protein